MGDWQTWAALAVVLLAVLFLLSKVLRKKKKSGCGSGCGCGKTK